MSLNDNEEFDFEKEERMNLTEAFERFDAAARSGEALPCLSEEEYSFAVDRYASLGNDEMAETAAAEGFSRYPYSLDLLVKYCDSLVIKKELTEALSLLENYRDSFPPSSEIYLSFSRVYIGKKKIALARKYYEKAIGIEAFPEDICDSVHTLAQDCMDSEEYQEALFYLDKAKELTAIWDKKNARTEHPDNLATFYFDYAFCCEKTGDTESAVKYYDKYLDIDPFSDMAWYNLGTIYTKLNDLPKAQEAFEYAVALNKENSSALYNLAIVYINTDRYADAMNMFTEFLKIEKGNIGGIIGLADSYIGLNNLKQAEILFRKALMLDPGCHEAKVGLSILKEIKKNKNNE